MTAARRALRGAAGMTDRSCSLERMVRRCGHSEKAFESWRIWGENDFQSSVVDAASRALRSVVRLLVAEKRNLERLILEQATGANVVSVGRLMCAGLGMVFEPLAELGRVARKMEVCEPC